MGRPYGNTNHLIHGKRKTRLYTIWSNIKTRCLNKNDPHYERWGARGISICNEWRDNFQSFYDWAMSHGYSKDLNIDRIDNDGDYCPENCRWVTVKENNQNKRNCILITYDGITMSAAAWSAKLGLGKDTVRQRYHKGWTAEECLFGRR